MRVPMHDLIGVIDDGIIDGITHTLKVGCWTNQPRYNLKRHYAHGNVNNLEDEFADYIGVKHAICVSNGTAALITALAAIGLQPGDEVLVPSFTFFADVEAILFHGAKPVFVDINPDTYTMDTSDLLNKFTRKTAGVIPVHLFGLPCDMTPIQKDCWGIIEDCSQAHGAEYKGKKVGSIGNIGCFSLYPTKNMYCGGEGGLLTTNDDDLAEKMRAYINHGDKDGLHHTLGYNFRMSEVQGAIARYSLRELDSNNKKRIDNARQYTSRLDPIDIQLPQYQVTGDTTSNVYHCYTIQVDNPEALQVYLKGHGIETTRFYETPAHEQPVMKHHGFGCSAHISEIGAPITPFLPHTDKVKDRVLQLPIGPHLTTEQVDFVIEKVKEFFQ